MNAIINLWIAALVLGAAIVVQWAVLRARYRRALTLRHARHMRQQQTASCQLEQVKLQVEQLQQDLAAARLQVKRLTAAGAAPSQSRARAKEALERALDDATALRHRLPPDGFADTLPSPQIPDYVGLLLR